MVKYIKGCSTPISLVIKMIRKGKNYIRDSLRGRTKLVLITLLLVIGSIFTIQSVFTRTEVIEFYPSTCLGSWKNPERAQGEPDNFLSEDKEDISDFSEVNSAVLDVGEGQIFCGGFVPSDFSESGEVKSVDLTISWKIEGLPKVELPEPTVLPETMSTSTSSSTEEVVSDVAEEGSKEVEGVEEGGEGGRVDPVDSPNPPNSLNRFLVPLVYAHEEDVIQENLSVEPNVVEPPLQDPAESPSSEEKPIEGDITPVEEKVGVNEVADTKDALETREGLDTSQKIQERGGVEGVEAEAEAEATTTPLEEFIYEPPQDFDENFLKISYSLDGQNWIFISKVSNLNWENLTFSLPVSSWEDLRKIQLSVETIPSALDQLPKVYLDGFVMNVQYDIPPAVDIFEGDSISNDDLEQIRLPEQTPVIELSPDKKPISPDGDDKSFGSDETPIFDFDLKHLPNPTSSPPADLNSENGGSKEKEISKNDQNQGREKLPFFSFWGFLKQAFAKEEFKVGDKVLNVSNPMIARVVDSENRPTNIDPFLMVVNEKLRISLPEPPRAFKPGKYRVELWILKNDIVYFTSTDFSWGVLAVNFNKSVFKKGDKALVSFGVLDDRGHTICDADLQMTITSPSGKTSVFSTDLGDITQNETCEPENVTQNPDYSTEFTVREMGEYQVEVAAQTSNGERKISDKFLANQELNFDIERTGPTRIFPFALYEMGLRITPKEDFRGEIKEVVPADFILITQNYSIQKTVGDVKEITWNVDIRAGEAIELRYFFDPPDISPELFKLGPLEMRRDLSTADRASGSLSFSASLESEPIFKEARSWQLASDAAGEIILMWEGATIPTGWDCISCDAGDPLIDVFPRASSTYGSASSSNHLHSHFLTFSSEAASENNISVGVVNDTTPNEFPGTHTHTTWTTSTLSSGDNRPLYRGLKFIRAATTTLPAGAIGMFSTNSSSLPSGWGFYQPMYGNYLMGTSTVGTGGASTHIHSTNSTSTSGTPTILIDDTGSGRTVSGISHRHDISRFSQITFAANNPAYVEVVFASSSATTTLGANTDGLIAMFDNTSLPSGWDIFSTSGSPYSGNFLKGSYSGGAVGGTSSTHNHTGSVTWASKATTSTLAVLASTARFEDTGTDHVHDVTYTISSSNTLPIYRDVILGKYTYTAPAALTVSNVVLNNGSSIILTAGATTTVTVKGSSTKGSFDLNYATATISRSGLGFNCTADNANCYQIPSSSCAFSGTSSSSVTCSADIYYFAQATDASSSYPSETWKGQITLTDVSPSSTSSSTVTGQELLTLLAMELVTSTLNYGSLSPTSTTGAVNQLVPVKNVGNSSASIQVYGSALSKGAYSIATSSQHYASTTFLFGGSEGQLSNTATTISGLTLLPKTTLINTLVGWANTATMPTARAWAAGAAWNNFAYVAGGSNAAFVGTSSVMYANINTTTGVLGSWTETQAMPSALVEHTLGVGSGYIYVIGGANNPAGQSGTTTTSYASLASNGTIASWNNTTALPIPLFGHASVLYKGYLYVSGGTSSTTAGHVTSSVLFSKVSSDGTLGTWSYTTALPSVILHHKMVAYNDSIYVIGGEINIGASAATTTVLKASIASDGSLGSWISQQPLPENREEHISGVMGDYIYVVGGSSGSGGNNATSTYYTQVSSTGTISSWTLDFTGGLSRVTAYHAGIFYNGVAYSAGGGTAVSCCTNATTSVFYSNIYNGKSQKDTFWGLGLSDYVPTGTYMGSTTFIGVFAP